LVFHTINASNPVVAHPNGNHWEACKGVCSTANASKLSYFDACVNSKKNFCCLFNSVQSQQAIGSR
jgi:hypothetical protein